MTRLPTKTDDLASIEARREILRAELSALDERAKADAKAIAAAIGRHGGKIVADHLASLPSS